jgi:hypothetical protein
VLTDLSRIGQNAARQIRSKLKDKDNAVLADFEELMAK